MFEFELFEFEPLLKNVLNMETMSFRFGFDDYIYYNQSVFWKNEICKEMDSIEIFNSKKLNNGEKNR